jgi:hypothetical protein
MFAKLSDGDIELEINELLKGNNLNVFTLTRYNDLKRELRLRRCTEVVIEVQSIEEYYFG